MRHNSWPLEMKHVEHLIAEVVGQKPANENPWYVLMTLYGEQPVGLGFNSDLAERNRKAWNAWAGQGLSEAERIQIAGEMEIDPEELAAWPERQAEIKERHRQEWVSRNPGKDYPGIPRSQDEVNFNQLKIINNLSLDSFYFNSTFNSGAVIFNRAFSMCMAKFKGTVIFAFAQFRGISIFKGTKFSGHAAFNGAEFSDTVEFHSANFSKNSSFWYVKFSGEVNFENAQFDNTVYFNNAHFDGSASFNSTKFSDSVYFVLTKSKAYLDFSGAQFGEPNGKQKVDFTHAEFEKPLNFKDAIFHANYPVFAGVTLPKQTIFTAKAENWPRHDIDDHAVEAAIESCAIIRHNRTERGLIEDEQFFYAREMALRGRIGTCCQRLPYWIYGLTSGYGQSIKRPFLSLLILWLVVGIVSSFTLQLGLSPDIPKHASRGFTLSFINMFPFLGIEGRFFETGTFRTIPASLKIIGMVQALIAPLLLFLLGLGLRNRFRMK